MTKQTVKILNAILMNEKLTDEDNRRLVIVEKLKNYMSDDKRKDTFLSFENLTSEDFFEIARYKKGFEIDKDEKYLPRE